MTDREGSQFAMLDVVLSSRLPFSLTEQHLGLDPWLH